MSVTFFKIKLNIKQMNKNIKLTKTNKSWFDVEYNLTVPSIISRELLSVHINAFWLEVMDKLNDDQHLLFILRAKFDSDQRASISTMKKINKTSKEYLLEYLLSRLSLSNEAYNITPVKTLVFSCGIRKGEIIPDLMPNVNKVNYQSYYNNKLPVTTIPEEYGKIVQKSGNKYVISVNDNSFILLNTLIKNKQRINNIQYLKKGVLMFNWIDKITGDNTFTREIGKSSYHYINKELVLVKIIKKSKAIINTKVSIKINEG